MFRVSRIGEAFFLPLFFCSFSFQAVAHVDWTQGNGTIPGVTVGLYHFDDHDAAPGDTLEAAIGLPADRGLLIGTPSGDTFHAIHDTPEPLFEPHCLQLRSAQIADSTETVSDLGGDLTIEFWFKWDTDLTYQRAQIGLRSGAKIEIARSVVNPASDVFGVSFVHGDFVPAPGFTNWADVGEEEGSLGEWRHVAITIHSTGIHYENALGHDVYNAGSTLRFWLNGHATGTDPHTADITGIQMHPDSMVRIRGFEGQIKIDELTIWRYDWSQDGLDHNPFGEGRSAELFSSSNENWKLY